MLKFLFNPLGIDGRTTHSDSGLYSTGHSSLISSAGGSLVDTQFCDDRVDGGAQLALTFHNAGDPVFSSTCPPARAPHSGST